MILRDYRAKVVAVVREHMNALVRHDVRRNADISVAGCDLLEHLWRILLF